MESPPGGCREGFGYVGPTIGDLGGSAGDHARPGKVVGVPGGGLAVSVEDVADAADFYAESDESVYDPGGDRGGPVLQKPFDGGKMLALSQSK
jgi:hypothetical protein